MTEIRLIRGDAAGQRRERNEGGAPESLHPLIRSIAGGSIEEIDRIFLELQRIRDVLQGEGARLSGELARYASLNQSLQATMKVIGESLTPIASTRENARIREP
jgi:hypothetical protein